MNADITKCSNENCVMKEKCYRYTVPQKEYNQSFQKFVPKRNSIDNFKCDLLYVRDERIHKNIGNRQSFNGEVQGDETGD